MTGQALPDPPVVMKFGGACFLSLGDFQVIADFIASRLAQARRVIAVVSAMSGTTGNLQHAQRELSDHPPADLIAQLLTAGETVSAALLATALCHRGVLARAISAREIGLEAAGSAECAQLTGIDPAPLWSALADAPVLVIPGGQAADSAGRIVMLGRNSSTFSAVAVAVAVGAHACEVISDVAGIFTGDPYVIPEAHLITELSYPAARWMAMSGAKIIPATAVDLAERHSIRLICRAPPPAATVGTVISASGDAPAVVAGTRSRAWAFADPDALERAHGMLAATARTQDVLVVDCDGAGHLVAPDGDPHGTVARACAVDGVLRPDLQLMTTLRGRRRPDWALVPAATLVEQARRRHEALYPPAGSQKRPGRSPLSSVLLAGGAGNAAGQPARSGTAVATTANRHRGVRPAGQTAAPE